VALDDFTDIDDETLGGLGDLFDIAVPDAASARPEPDTAPEPALDDDGAVDDLASGSIDDTHFLDDPSIDDELLSSVEDVLSELDDIETSEEELFGLHADLGAPQRGRAAGRARRAGDGARAFPDIQPVEADALEDDDDDDGATEHWAPATGPARAGWLPTLAILAANLMLLLFAWNASRSLQSGLQDVRNELDVVRSTGLAPADPGASATRGAASSMGAHTQQPAEGEAAGPDAAPLPAFDQVALEIAQREMERGLYPSARRRLYGVLALADRIDPERRADVEARLGFLIADSYRFEAELRRKVAQ
jgi:hypothetical protein